MVLWVGKVGLNGPGVGEREKLELDLFDTSRSPAPFFLLLRILSNLTSSLFSCCCIVAKICKIGEPKSHQSKRMSAIGVWLAFCKYWFIPAVPAEDSEWAWDQEISFDTLAWLWEQEMLQYYHPLKLIQGTTYSWCRRQYRCTVIIHLI